MTLQEAGEFGLIRRIKNKLAASDAVPLGIGDDAAAVPSSSLSYTLLTTDTLVEHIHFDCRLSRFSQLGYKALAVNLSDIAAMGGKPSYFLVSLGLRNNLRLADLDQLYRGLAKASEEAKVLMVGGNTSQSKKQIFIGITLIGEIAKTELVSRAKAKVGDALYVTGTLGDAAAGLSVLKENADHRKYAKLIRRYQSPQARVQEGRALGKEKIPSAMIDISDGLTADLNHILEASHVGAELFLERIPISPSLRRYARAKKSDPLNPALYGGEDYELLFCLPQKKISKFEKLCQRGVIQATHIGCIIDKGQGLVLREKEGGLRKLKPGGYDHFKKVK